MILTGAAGGMGAEAVRDLLARGDVNVVAVDISDDALRQLEETLIPGTQERLQRVTADVSDPAAVRSSVDQAIARWGRLDGVFSMAAIAEGKSITESSVADYERTMNVNARSAWLLMKYAIPALLERGGGRIVNTGSALSNRGKGSFSAYAASKHALVGMTKSIALEYAAQNIVANVVCPGSMDTKMVWEARRAESPDDPDGAHARWLEQLPRKRLARPDEAAAVGNWLLLDAPWHLSGQVIHVDGAYQAG